MKEVGPVVCRVHVLVCANVRAPGGLPSCGAGGAGVYGRLKAWTMQARAVREVWITEARCLGYCHASGATVAIYYPGRAEGPVFLQGVGEGDVAELVRRYVTPALQRGVA